MTKTIENVSLVLEGGTFRTVYTAGVLDAFMEENLYFPYIVGVSAGAINTVSYVSKQQKRTLNEISQRPSLYGLAQLLERKKYGRIRFRIQSNSK